MDFAYEDTIQSETWYVLGYLRVSVLEYCTNCNLPFVDKYLGLRLTEGNDHYYGWIRLDADIDTLLFKDFALNTVANEPIIAGHTSSAGIEDGKKDKSMVYFDGKSLRFDGSAFNHYVIYNIEGKLVEKDNTSVNGVLDLLKLPPGFFIVTLSGPEAVVTTKIIKN
jgi:hypothetical protein